MKVICIINFLFLFLLASCEEGGLENVDVESLSGKNYSATDYQDRNITIDQNIRAVDVKDQTQTVIGTDYFLDLKLYGLDARKVDEIIINEINCDDITIVSNHTRCSLKISDLAIPASDLDISYEVLVKYKNGDQRVLDEYINFYAPNFDSAISNRPLYAIKGFFYNYETTNIDSEYLERLVLNTTHQGYVEYDLTPQSSVNISCNSAYDIRLIDKATGLYSEEFVDCELDPYLALNSSSGSGPYYYIIDIKNNEPVSFDILNVNVNTSAKFCSVVSFISNQVTVECSDSIDQTTLGLFLFFDNGQETNRNVFVNTI